MSSETITISVEEYLVLLNYQAVLVRLENGGVDNWEWYDWCMEDYKEITEEDIK